EAARAVRAEAEIAAFEAVVSRPFPVVDHGVPATRLRSRIAGVVATGAEERHGDGVVALARRAIEHDALRSRSGGRVQEPLAVRAERDACQLVVRRPLDAVHDYEPVAAARRRVGKPS